MKERKDVRGRSWRIAGSSQSEAMREKGSLLGVFLFPMCKETGSAFKSLVSRIGQ